MVSLTQETKAFYDQYWPRNLPDYLKTKDHVLKLLPKRSYHLILDGGCGTGVCSIALSGLGNRVIALDISRNSMLAGKKIVNGLHIQNISFIEGSLLNPPFGDESFDLVFSWGAIHHTTDPIRALDELVRVLKYNGVIILAVYLKTNLTWLHELLRKTCLKFSYFKLYRSLFINLINLFIKFYDMVKMTERARDDSPHIKSLVEDWFFVPEKHFFTIDQVRQLFQQRNLAFGLLYEKIARFKSTTCFIVRGFKKWTKD